MRRALLLLLLLTLASCASNDEETAVADGDARLGKQAIERFDCGVCHRIPGIRSARGRVGPPLDHYRQRVYVAGRFPNTAEHVRNWIRHPVALAPETAMPDLGVSETDARDIAAYLYSQE